MIDITIVSYKRFPFTKMCLEYLKERTKTKHQIIVIDNGSGPSIQGLLVDYREKELIDHLVLLNKNYGIHAGWNIALSIASTELFITMDNDILVPDLEPDWLSQLETLMERYPDYSAIACQPHIFVGRQPFPEDSEEVIEVGHAGASPRIMRRQDIKKAGGWKDTFNSKRNDEEKTIAEKIHSLGKKVGFARDLRAFHKFGLDDNWGYENMPIEQHGHREIWPRTSNYEKMENYDQKTWFPLEKNA